MLGLLLHSFIHLLYLPNAERRVAGVSWRSSQQSLISFDENGFHFHDHLH